MKDLDMNSKDFVGLLYFKLDDVIIDIQYLDDVTWTNVYHKSFGLCYNLNLERSNEYKYISLDKYDGRPKLLFYLKKK